EAIRPVNSQREARFVGRPPDLRNVVRGALSHGARTGREVVDEHLLDGAVAVTAEESQALAGGREGRRPGVGPLLDGGDLSGRKVVDVDLLAALDVAVPGQAAAVGRQGGEACAGGKG